MLRRNIEVAVRRLAHLRRARALAVAKERGVKLGNPALAEARVKAEESRAAGADEFARTVAPVIRSIQGEGVTTLRGIARELVARKVETRRGGAWTPVQVTDLLKRLDRVAA